MSYICDGVLVKTVHGTAMCSKKVWMVVPYSTWYHWSCGFLFQSMSKLVKDTAVSLISFCWWVEHFSSLSSLEISSKKLTSFESKISSGRRGGFEVECLLHNLHDSTSVGSNPARRQKDFRNNSNTMGDTLINNVQKLTWRTVICINCFN